MDGEGRHESGTLVAVRKELRWEDETGGEGEGREGGLRTGLRWRGTERVEGKLIGSWDAGRRCRPPMARAWGAGGCRFPET